MVLLHQLEAVRQDVGRDAGEGDLEILEATRATEEVSDHEERPAVAHDLQRLGDGAALAVDLGHARILGGT